MPDSAGHQPTTTTRAERGIAMAGGVVAGLWVAGWLGGISFGFHPRPDLTASLSATSLWGIPSVEAIPFLVALVLTLATMIGLGVVGWASHAIRREHDSDVDAPRHQLAIVRALPVGGLAGLVAGATFWGLSGRLATGLTFGVAWAGIAGCAAAWVLAARTVPGDRFVLGHRGRDGWPGSSWVTAPPAQNVLVIASPRGRKSSNVLIPCLLSIEGSAVFTSTRSDVLESVYRWRRARGTVWLYDPMSLLDPVPLGVRRLRWTPLSTEWQVCWEHAAHFATSAGAAVTNSDFWRDSARKLIALTFYAAALDELPLSQTPELADEPELRTIASLIGKHGVHQAQVALRGLAAARELKSIQSQAGTGLALFHAGTVKQGDEVGETMNMDAFLSSEHSLAIVAKPDVGGANGIGPLIACLFGDLSAAIHRVSHASRVSEGTDRLPVHHVWVLDELANLAPIPSLSSVVSESAGRNHFIMAAIQSKNQLIARYGDADAGSLWDAFGCKVFGPGLTDASTLNDLASMLGAHTALQERLQGRAQARDAQSRLLEHELRELKLGTFLVVSQSQAAEVVHGNYFADTPPFADRAKGILTPAPGRGRRAGGALLGAWVGLVQDVWTWGYDRRHPARTLLADGPGRPGTADTDTPNPGENEPRETRDPRGEVAAADARNQDAPEGGVRSLHGGLSQRGANEGSGGVSEEDEDGLGETHGEGLETQGSEAAGAGEQKGEEATTEQLTLPWETTETTAGGTDGAGAVDGLVLAAAGPLPPQGPVSSILPPPQELASTRAERPSAPPAIRGQRPKATQSVIPNRLPQGCEACGDVVRPGDGIAWRTRRDGWLVLHEGCRDAA